MIGIVQQLATVVNRPLCPKIIHDNDTRIIVMLILISLLSAALYYVIKFYDKP